MKVEVDKELYVIILAMKNSKLADKAIRNYAKAFIGEKEFKELLEKIG